MYSRVVLSIDCSTTACKAIAWNEQGQALAEGRAAYSMHRPHKGWAEQRADEWWSCTCAALRECIAQLAAANVATDQIDALGITHQRETFVPVDIECRPIRDAILWLDERSRDQLEWLDRTFGADALHQLTGKPPSMTQSLPKIVWLLQNQPDVIKRANKIVDVHGFLSWRLTGQWRTSLASADPMALIDMQTGAWALDLIHELGLRLDQFAETVQPGSVIGKVTADAAAATGLPTGLPVIAGAGDGQCAGLGANAVTEGRAYLNMGTGIASGVLSEHYRVDRAFRTLTAPVPGAYYLEHILRGGVFTVAWFVEQFGMDLRDITSASPEELLEARAASIPPGSEGLMLVPYWNSVMNPYWDPSATGITVGWTGDHTRSHMYRAILEGVAYEQRLVGDAIADATGEPIREYTAMGGGSRSVLWREIMANVTGVPVVCSTATEATCLGAAILAATASGWYADVVEAAEAMTSTVDRDEPDDEAKKIYDDLYREVYRPLFPTLQPLLKRLTDLSD